jgi:predicted DsbA family dithiol-disulfide isomerase
MATAEKMKVEIWSDIMCPFCYIGKRKFEKALDTFPKYLVPLMIRKKPLHHDQYTCP